MTSALEWIGLAFSFVGTLLSSWNFSYSVVFIPIKVAFNYTQSQVELTSSMLSIGNALSPLEPLISHKYGYEVSYLIGGIIAPITAALSYAAVNYKEFFHVRPALLGLIQTLAGVSSSFMYMLIIGISVEKCSQKHTGKILGIYTGIGAFGKIFYTSLMWMLSGDIGNFFAVITLIWIVVFGGCLIFHRKHPRLRNTVQEEAEEFLEQSRKEHLEVKPLHMLKSIKFHLCFWPGVLLSANMVSFLINLTSFGDSAGMDQPWELLYVFSTVMGLTRIFTGILFDSLRSTFMTFTVIFTCYCCFITAMIIGIVWFNGTGVFILTFLGAIGLTSAYSLPITMLINAFGQKNHTIIISLLSLSCTMFVILNQTAIGFFYDAEIVKNGQDGLFCWGKDCFRHTFILMITTTGIALVVQIVNAFSFRIK